MDINKNIENIIFKFLDNKASLSELDLLLQWIGNEKNYESYVEYISINNLTNLALNKIDKENIINEINLKINSDNKHLIKKSRFKYSSFALITICLFFFVFYLTQSDKNEILKSIDPSKITLTTSNGDVIDLEDLGDQQTRINDNVLINQNVNTLYYKNNPVLERLTYNTIKVPYSKVYNIELSDGTRVYLNSGTTLKFPVNFIKDLDREVFLDGEAFFEVTNNNISQFKVTSNNISAHVYGTKFNFKGYPEDDFAEVILTEGSLGVGNSSDNFENNILKIKPGEKAKVIFSSGEIETSRVNTSLYTSWIDGRVAFRNESLPGMIQKLERIYNVVIINNNNDLKEKYFTATILYKEESINDVLSYLSQVYGLKYQIINNKILIE
ncbi:MAG: hypothetical protein CMC04_01920 [Flavobacteriaceae bacterium]|nr:hypothetical protein [Flavobacteriaceae bacterium]